MKRKVGTLVLFVLLILTVIALKKINIPASAQSVGETASKTSVSHVVK